MKTTWDRHREKQIPVFGWNDRGHSPFRDQGCHRQNRKAQRWAAACATAGAAVWAAIAVLARMGMARLGAIELLFLFAPLVLVPLGMELGRVLGDGGWLTEVGRRLQPAGAGLAIVAMWLPPGRRAGLAALGWLLICALMAGAGFLDLILAPWADAGAGAHARQIVMGIAGVDLAVGGAWLVASRWGMRPMGIEEPIGLMTAVHFHFAGFATAMIAAATLRFAEKRGPQPWLKGLILIVVGLPFVVAAGFMISPKVKMVAALLFSASVAGLAIVLRACGRKAEQATARILLQVAAGAVFAAMVLSGAYAVGDFLGNNGLTIPQMARTHGILNAVGFCLSGLLGWLVENSRQLPVARGQYPARLRSWARTERSFWPEVSSGTCTLLQSNSQDPGARSPGLHDAGKVSA